MKVLPVHPRNGLVALGFRRNGDPIWPIRGAAEETPEEKVAREAAEAKAAEDARNADDPDKDDADLTDAEKAALGEPGKQAIDRTKVKWQRERDARRAAEAELAALKAAPKKPAKDDDTEAALEAARQRATDEAVTKATKAANDRVLRSEIKSAAAGKLADPSLALKLIDLSDFEADKNGDFDEDEIKDAIDELLKEHPYLAAQGRSKFQGDADAGDRGNRDAKKQLTKADVAKLSAEQIVQAQKDGLLVEYLKTPNG